MRLPTWLRQHLAALRALLVFTVALGLLYPLALTAIAQLPGLTGKANGSLVKTANGQLAGSAIIGQSFVDADGHPLKQYLQSRPSAAGAGYDPTATSASNLGPESIVDTLPDPSNADDAGRQSLLTQVCARSRAVGELEGVSGARPFCTASGVGAVLAVFGTHTGDGHITRVVSLNETCRASAAGAGSDAATPFVATWQGVPVSCAKFGEDYSAADVVPVRGDAPAQPAVPADAVTASASGLDPGISPAYARLQAPRIARVRGLPLDRVTALITAHTTGRALGFMGEPSVNVLQLNLDLDATAPYHG
jgi:potassium-transporting ATPase KdpC subunit